MACVFSFWRRLTNLSLDHLIVIYVVSAEELTIQCKCCCVLFCFVVVVVVVVFVFNFFVFSLAQKFHLSRVWPSDAHSWWSW